METKVKEVFMINVAIIGIGAISDSHIKAYLQFRDRCKIIALVDRSKDKAQNKIDEYGLDAIAVDSYEELKEREDIELVSICLPPGLHTEVTCEMLKAGKHVLCEKPLAPTVSECDLMIQTAKECKKLLSVVAQNRFKPDVIKVKKLVDSGILGKKHFALASSLWWRGENYYNLSWRGKWDTEGGGCTLIHGIHHIDLFLWMMGKPKQLRAEVYNRAHTNSEVEDISLGEVIFEDGSVGSMITSIIHHGEEQRIILDAEHGSVELPFAIHASKQLENGFPEDNMVKLEEIHRFCDNIELIYSGHTGQIDDMLSAIETGRRPLVTGEDGRLAIEFISALYQSAFLKEEVKLPLSKNDPFYTKAGIQKHAIKFYEKTVSIDKFSNNEIQVGGTL